MNNFWSLLGFEYKKILKRKSFAIALLITLFMSAFCMVGEVFVSESNRKEMYAQRDASHHEAGYLDQGMINTMIEKNSLANAVVTDDGNYPDGFNGLESGEDIDFYAIRTDGIKARLKQANFPQNEIDHTLRKNSKLATPFYFDFHGGYTKFLIMMSTSAVFIIFVLSMCLAPIFADEYRNKTDSIILSSKYGKNKLIRAKIFTIITFSLLFTAISLITALIATFSVYSSIGGNVSFQVWKFFSVYPLTMAKAVLLYCLVIICTTLLICSICAILSAYFNSFATITTVMLLLVGSMFLTMPLENMRTLNFFLPAKMIDPNYVFSDRLVKIAGIYIEPYIFIPVLCLLLTVILLPLAYKGFKNHQVS